MAQQLPVQRGKEGPLEHRIVLDLLEQYIRLHLQGMFENIRLQIAAPGDFRRHLHTRGSQHLGLGLELRLLELQVSLPLAPRVPWLQ